MAFLIVYGEGPTDRLVAYQFSSRATAQAASLSSKMVPGVPPGSHAGGHAYVIENEEDVTFNGALLTAVFNGLTDSGIKKFETRAIGVKRLLSVLPTVAKQQEDTTMENTTAPAAAGKANGKGGKKPRATVAEGHATKKDWTKPRDGTMRAKILRAMIGRFKTIAQIAADSGQPEDRILPHVYATWRDCGIGYKLDGDKYQADLPEGVTVKNLFAEPVEKAPKTPKAPKAGTATAAA
jgi:hypothetical protein